MMIHLLFHIFLIFGILPFYGLLSAIYLAGAFYVGGYQYKRFVNNHSTTDRLGQIDISENDRMAAQGAATIGALFWPVVGGSALIWKLFHPIAEAGIVKADVVQEKYEQNLQRKAILAQDNIKRKQLVAAYFDQVDREHPFTVVSETKDEVIDALLKDLDNLDKPTKYPEIPLSRRLG